MTSFDHLNNALKNVPIVAILRGFSPALTVAAFEAVWSGGILAAEVPLNSPDALKTIEKLRVEVPGMIIGAGTVCTSEEAQRSIAAGAQFLVSPIVSEDVLDAAHGMPCIPGAMTPTEIYRAHTLGAFMVKLFPVSGPSFIREIRGPFPSIPLLPTGGITSQNAKEYLEAGATALGAGSALFPGKLVELGDQDGIQQQARKLLAAIG